MKKRIAFVAALAMLMFANGISAQIAHGGAPMFNRTKAQVQVVSTPTLDNEKYLQEDIDMVPGSSPLRMGVLQQVSLSNLNDGSKRTLADGTQVWQLAISSPDAFFMNVGFSTFDIPEGAELYLYDESGDYVLGRFTRENMNEDGGFYTQSLPGDVIYLEYREPAEVAGQGVIIISDVTHGYKNIFGDALGFKGALGDAEGNCHINVKCNTANDWRDQIRSVVCLQIYAGDYIYSCSGAMINNCRQDRTPYILTAFHCQDDLGAPISRWIAYFNYQTTMCNNNSGPYNQSVTGATIVAKYNLSDFCLLRLNSNVPDAYKPYYAGWERSNLVNETLGSCIHHPGGDFKKISFPKKVTRGSGSNQKTLVVDWFTGTQNQGVTEQGSSGSPLFNADKRIVGQLWRGSSSCDYMSGQDYYGRVYSSWTGNSTSSTARLSDWLDPDGTDVSYLDGLDYKDPEVSINNAEMAAPMAVYPNPSKGIVNIDVDAIGEASYRVFDMSGRCVYEGRTILTATAQSLNLSQLAAGCYNVQLFAGSRTFSAQVNIVK